MAIQPIAPIQMGNPLNIGMEPRETKTGFRQLLKYQWYCNNCHKTFKKPDLGKALYESGKLVTTNILSCPFCRSTDLNRIKEESN